MQKIIRKLPPVELGSEGGRDWEDIDIYVITENKYKQFGIDTIPRKVSRESEKREWFFFPLILSWIDSKHTFLFLQVHKWELMKNWILNNIGT